MRKVIALLVMLGMAEVVAAAQNADDYRGGWRTESGEPHTYEFSIRGDQVRGIYCTRCSNATTLAFIDGKFGSDGIVFVVTHVKADGSTAYQDRATAKFDKGKLIITGLFAKSVISCAVWCVGVVTIRIRWRRWMISKLRATR